MCRPQSAPEPIVRGLAAPVALLRRLAALTLTGAHAFALALIFLLAAALRTSTAAPLPAASGAAPEDEVPVATPVPKAASPFAASPHVRPGPDALATTSSAPLTTSRVAPVSLPRTRLRERFPDPLALRPLSPNFDLYPDSSLADFSRLLDAPAGKHGFVTAGDDGHFVFSGKPGRRARFWGVTITQEHIDIPKHRIDEVVDTLARAGCNMVRFHSLDNRAGLEFGFLRRTLIDENPPHNRDTQHFDPEYLDRLDYWIARLKERGIYTFLVLRAFRHYLEGDDVPSAGELPRGAAQVAFFNDRLIALQEQFARDLLFEHVNPYTGLPYGRDPAVALVELFNEDSLFSRPHLWHSMPEPYQSEFQALWTDYLRRSHGTTDRLREAWTNAAGRSALAAGESLEAGNVALPDMDASQSFEQAQAEAWTDPRRSPARRRDGVRFAVELQRKYFRRMLDSLEKMGLRVPVTGVVAGLSVPDTFSAAREFGFTAENMYQEHPEFEPGRPWLPPAYYRNTNYLMTNDPHSGIPFVTLYRWSGKPLAVREWATSWPNEYRASGILEMAAYGRLQDVDALLAFAFYTTGDFTRLTPFGLNSDPVRWGMFGLGAQVFLGEETVRPAERLVQIAYSPEDLSAYSAWTDPLHTMAWVHRVENVLLTPDFQTSADLLLLSGRGHATGYRGQYGFIYSNADWVTAEQKQRAEGKETVWAKSGYEVTPRPGDGMQYVFEGIGHENDLTTTVESTTCFAVEDLIRARLEPFARTPDGKFALGAYDGLRKNLIFGRLPWDEVVRLALGVMHHWYETPMSAKEYARGLLVSDTGELIRDTRRGLMAIDTPLVQAVQGRLTTGTVIGTPSGGLEILSQSPVGAVAALSLDGEPLDDSRRFLVKMVTVAENRKQLLEPATHPAMKGRLVMAVEGGTPIVTKAMPLEDRATLVRLNGRPLVEVAMENGTWELLVDLDRRTAWLACDLPNARFRLDLPADGRRVENYTLTPWTHETGPRETVKSGKTFPYPGWCKYVEIRF